MVCMRVASKIADLSLQEATRALVPILGQYYMKDKRNVLRAIWEDRNACRWIAPDKEVPDSGVYWYKQFKSQH